MPGWTPAVNPNPFATGPRVRVAVSSIAQCVEYLHLLTPLSARAAAWRSAPAVSHMAQAYHVPTVMIGAYIASTFAYVQ